MTSTAVTTLTIPRDTVPATYQVIALVDALGQQAELDEGNNTAVSSPVVIGLYRPDLSVTALTSPATGQMGRPLAITNTVLNGGPAPAGPFSVRFYLSGDGTLDAQFITGGGAAANGALLSCTCSSAVGSSDPAVKKFASDYKA